MAVTSGSFSTSGSTQSGVTRNLVFSWTRLSTNSTSTTISWTLKGGGTYGGSDEKWQYIYSWSVVFTGADGNPNQSWTGTSQLHYDDVLKTGTATFTHTSEKTFSVSVQAAIYYSSTNCTGSGSWTLPALTSASTISSVSMPTTSFNNNITINMTKGTGSPLYHILYWAPVNPTTNATGTYRELVRDNGSFWSNNRYIWSLSDTYGSNFIFSDNKTKIRFKLYTYSNTTYSGASIIGYSESDIISNISPSNSMLATISLSITDDLDNYYNSYNNFYYPSSSATNNNSSHGIIKFSSNFFGNNSLASQELKLNSSVVTTTSSSVNYSLANKNSNNKTIIDYYVIDNTGIKTSFTQKTINWVTTAPINYSVLDVYRSDSSGNRLSTGTYAAVLYNGDATTITLTAGSTSGTGQAQQGADTVIVTSGTISTTESVDVTVSLGSNFQYNTILVPAFVLFEIDKSGQGLGFGAGAVKGVINTGLPIRTSYRGSIAMGSYKANATTLAGLINEVRYSSGCMGSFQHKAPAADIETFGSLSFTPDPNGNAWYNFIYSPHRSGGVSGQTNPNNTDNISYGNLILMAMSGPTRGGAYLFRITSGSVAECKKILTADTDISFDTESALVLPNNISLKGRNAADTGNVNLIGLSGTNDILMGYNNPGYVKMYVGNHANSFTFNTNGTVDGIVKSTYKDITLSKSTYTAGTSGYISVTWNSTLPRTPIFMTATTSSVSNSKGIQLTPIYMSTTGGNFNYYCPQTLAADVTVRVTAYYV